MSLESAVEANTLALKEHSSLLAKLLERSGAMPQAAQDTAAKLGSPEQSGKSETTEKKPGTTVKAGQKNSSDTTATSQTSGGGSSQESSTDEAITFDIVKKAILDVSKKSKPTPDESRLVAEALLQRFGVQKISAIPENRWGEAHGMAVKTLAGEYDPRDAELPEDAESLE